MRPPMLDEATRSEQGHLDEAFNAGRGRQHWTRSSLMRPPMLDEIVLDEVLLILMGRQQRQKYTPIAI